MTPGLFTASSNSAAHETMGFLSALGRRIPCANLQRTLNIKLTSIGLFDLLDHFFFLLFCARFSRGTKRASGACSPVPRAAFLRGSQETSLFVLFLGGTANPEGGRQRTDKAEARRAASAQAAFPSRRAREKAVPEKGTETRRSSAETPDNSCLFASVAAVDLSSTELLPDSKS